MKDNLFPKNSTLAGGDLKGAIPTAEEYYEISTTLASGTKTVTVSSSFGKGKGEVKGAYLLKSTSGTEVFGVSVAESTTDGKIDITITSSNSSSSKTLTDLPLMVFGNIIPAS